MRRIGTKRRKRSNSAPQEKNRVQEVEQTGAQVNGKALQGRNAPPTKPCGSKTKKKPWSYI
jgi:hypothetical protein